MTTIGIALALAAALLAQTAIVRMVASDGPPTDLVLIVVVLAALSRGRLAGLWTGTAGGLLQDMLSGGIIGISGLAKSVTGVLVGMAGSRFIIETIWQHLVVIAAASTFHTVSVLGVYALVGAAPAATATFVLSRAAAEGVLGISALTLARAVPVAVQRARQRLSRRRAARRPWAVSQQG
ncbi:MAG: rod shape-determining protein MreD [Acidobacteriota bacterium]|nr:rod shape-determining protein MreD [Acidobacteriota bacterium]